MSKDNDLFGFMSSRPDLQVARDGSYGLIALGPISGIFAHAHIRVDKAYSASKAFLSPWHITVVGTKGVNVHVYYDLNGQELETIGAVGWMDDQPELLNQMKVQAVTLMQAHVQAWQDKLRELGTVRREQLNKLDALSVAFDENRDKWLACLKDYIGFLGSAVADDGASWSHELILCQSMHDAVLNPKIQKVYKEHVQKRDQLLRANQKKRKGKKKPAAKSKTTQMIDMSSNLRELSDGFSQMAEVVFTSGVNLSEYVLKLISLHTEAIALLGINTGVLNGDSKLAYDACQDSSLCFESSLVSWLMPLLRAENYQVLGVLFGRKTFEVLQLDGFEDWWREYCEKIFSDTQSAEGLGVLQYVVRCVPEAINVVVPLPCLPEPLSSGQTLFSACDAMLHDPHIQSGTGKHKTLALSVIKILLACSPGAVLANNVNGLPFALRVCSDPSSPCFSLISDRLNDRDVLEKIVHAMPQDDVRYNELRGLLKDSLREGGPRALQGGRETWDRRKLMEGLTQCSLQVLGEKSGVMAALFGCPGVVRAFRHMRDISAGINALLTKQDKRTMVRAAVAQLNLCVDSLPAVGSKPNADGLFKELSELVSNLHTVRMLLQCVYDEDYYKAFAVYMGDADDLALGQGAKSVIIDEKLAEIKQAGQDAERIEATINILHRLRGGFKDKVHDDPQYFCESEQPGFMSYAIDAIDLFNLKSATPLSATDFIVGFIVNHWALGMGKRSSVTLAENLLGYQNGYNALTLKQHTKGQVGPIILGSPLFFAGRAPQAAVPHQAGSRSDMTNSP